MFWIEVAPVLEALDINLCDVIKVRHDSRGLTPGRGLFELVRQSSVSPNGRGVGAGGAACAICREEAKACSRWAAQRDR